MKYYKIIDSKWFNAGSDIIGYVAIDSAINQSSPKWKCYLGVVKYSESNKEDDNQKIAAWGTKVSKQIAIAVFPNLSADNFSY